MLVLETPGELREYPLVIRVCRSFLRRLTGALVQRRIPDDTAYLLTPCRRVHTWFMAEPIQVLHLDKTGRILRNEPRLPPYSMSGRCDSTVAVLELAPDRIPPGEISPQTRITLDQPSAREAGLNQLARRQRSS